MNSSWFRVILEMSHNWDEKLTCVIECDLKSWRRIADIVEMCSIPFQFFLNCKEYQNEKLICLLSLVGHLNVNSGFADNVIRFSDNASRSSKRISVSNDWTSASAKSFDMIPLPDIKADDLDLHFDISNNWEILKFFQNVL